MNGRTTGKVRIIAGRWRGRRLAVPHEPGLRPTGDRARETLFNWLQGNVPGARCLDLFAGSGALGLEAASRGAASVTLVERNRELAGALQSIAGQWPGGEVLKVVHADALQWLQDAGGPWDLVFVDPPFDAGLHAQVLTSLQRPGLLPEAARVYLESDARGPREPGNAWRILREKRLGEVRMQLLAPVRDNPAAGHSI